MEIIGKLYPFSLKIIDDIHGKPAVVADTHCIRISGRLRLDKAKLAAFAHGQYFELGKKIGKFGFSATKKKKRR